MDLPELPPRPQHTNIPEEKKKSLMPPPKPSRLKRTLPPGMAVSPDKIPKSRYDVIQSILAEKTWPLYFFGNSGRGKSSMAALIYAEWPYAKRTDVDATDWDREPLYWKASDITGMIADARFKNNGVRAIMSRIQMASLVVVDDIADRSATDGRRAALYDLLDWRENMPLILTGNFAPAELYDVIKDERIIGRINKGRRVEFDGPDMRQSGLPIIKV